MEEVFVDVKGYEEYFSISNLGNLFSKRSKKILKQTKNSTGYLSVATKIGGRSGINKCFRVHRLVAEAFIPNLDNKFEVNHKDGIKDNNVVSNLEWVTSSENKTHAVKLGLIASGADCKRAKFSDEDIRVIRNSNDRVGILAEKFNVHRNTITKIQSGITYKNVL